MSALNWTYDAATHPAGNRPFSTTPARLLPGLAEKRLPLTPNLLTHFMQYSPQPRLTGVVMLGEIA